MILRWDEPYAQVVVADHKILDRGTPQALIQQASVSMEESLDLQ
jgi:hypothetical protein